MKKTKDLTICFTRYDRGLSIRMLSLYHNELMGKIEECEGKKCFMVDDNILDKVLDKINEIIGIKNLMILLRF